MKYSPGQWLIFLPKACDCQVVGSSDFWDTPQYQVWTPSMQTMLWAEESQLQPLDWLQNLEKEPDRLLYLSAATKILQILDQASRGEELLSPIQSNLVPLPHQIAALKKIMGGSSLRFLLADEVGLGKTIEAGMVLKELKLRGLAKRILIVVPKGLATQWESEMRIHFNEEFHMINGEDIANLDRLFVSEGGAWKLFDQVLVSLDSIKPITRRKGWSKERVDAYNKTRLGNLLKATWDLIIIDEAHRIGGSTEQVARHKLGKALSDVAPQILLLSATPHQGKSDAFFRLLNILDAQAFPEPSAISKETVQPYLVRTEKRKALNEKGFPLFQPRTTTMVAVSWTAEYARHRELYEAVSEYVRLGYNKALKNKKPHIGFLMVLLQRLVTSSTLAIKTTLERRLEVLRNIQAEEQDSSSRLDLDELEELDGEEQQEVLIESSRAMFNEISTVESLLNLSNRCINEREDAKVVELRDLISLLESQDKDPSLKLLIFTEFVSTQKMLKEYFEQRGFKVATINGAMGREDRQFAQEQFESDARLLISTDAGGEGLNLQFAHIVVNYDLPWNPMKLEQRIGRVDRIGQIKPVAAFNFLLQDSVEFRVIEVLEQKLQIVSAELGIDKTRDVLESSDSAAWYQEALIKAVMNPEKADQAIEEAISEIKRENLNEQDGKQFLSSLQISCSSEEVRKIQESSLPLWTENLVLGYLRFKGKRVTKASKGWTLQWTEGRIQKGVGFHLKDRSASLLSTANPEVLALTSNLPEFHTGALIPSFKLPSLPSGVSGLWGMFECRIQSAPSEINDSYIKLPRDKRLLFPLFLSDEGKLFPSTAQRIWTLLATSPAESTHYLDKESSLSGAEALFLKAGASAKALLEEYRNELEQAIQRELARLAALGDYQYSRIEKTALNEVKHHRQARLALYNESIDQELQALRKLYPVLSCIMIAKIGE